MRSVPEAEAPQTESELQAWLGPLSAKPMPRDRPLWDGALCEFVREVGARVQERHGARFAPLGAIEQQLAERGVPVAVE